MSVGERGFPVRVVRRRWEGRLQGGVDGRQMVSGRCDFGEGFSQVTCVVALARGVLPALSWLAELIGMAGLAIVEEGCGGEDDGGRVAIPGGTMRRRVYVVEPRSGSVEVVSSVAAVSCSLSRSLVEAG